MAPLKPVWSLHDLCMTSVLNSLQRFLENKERSDDKNNLRKVLLGQLHGGIREQLIEKAILNGPAGSAILDLIELLGDSSMKQLQFTSAQSDFDCREVFDTLNISNIIGLNKLNLKVRVDKYELLHTSYQFDVFAGGLHNALRQGLASNLRVLTLHSAADNITLSILGKQATQLTYLDITSSWYVDDNGICDLLLKESSNFINEHWPDLDSCDPKAIKALSMFPESQRSQTCNTLCEVKIQDTNTSSVSVLLLLLFGKRLKSLGGFLYSRNIGDAILTVQHCLNSPSTLELSELWDTQLPFDKLSKLATYLPKLNTLYTRVACLPPIPNVLPPLKNLTADFDFVHYNTEIFGFLQYNGMCLKRLVLIDQATENAWGLIEQVPSGFVAMQNGSARDMDKNFSVPLTDVSRCCPVLEEIVAKVSIGDPRETFQKSEKAILQKITSEKREARAFPYLTSAKLRISSPNTFTWIMRNADNIKKLEIFLEIEPGTVDTFEDHVIENIVKENPKSLQSIHTLKLYMFWSPRSQHYTIACGTLSISSAYALCSASDSLRILGELQTWFAISREDVDRMAKHIIDNNWDVKIRFKNVLYP